MKPANPFNDKGGDMAYFAELARLAADPDLAVSVGLNNSVNTKYSVRKIRYELVQTGDKLGLATGSEYVFNFEFARGEGPVPVIHGVSTETVSQTVAWEIYNHPGHYVLRPHPRGQSGWP